MRDEDGGGYFASFSRDSVPPSLREFGDKAVCTQDANAVADPGGGFAFVSYRLGLWVDCVNHIAVTETGQKVFRDADEFE